MVEHEKESQMVVFWSPGQDTRRSTIKSDCDRARTKQRFHRGLVGLLLIAFSACVVSIGPTQLYPETSIGRHSLRRLRTSPRTRFGVTLIQQLFRALAMEKFPVTSAIPSTEAPYPLLAPHTTATCAIEHVKFLWHRGTAERHDSIRTRQRLNPDGVSGYLFARELVTEQ